MTRWKISDQAAIYFITKTIVEWQAVFSSDERCDVIIGSLKYCIEHNNQVDLLNVFRTAAINDGRGNRYKIW